MISMLKSYVESLNSTKEKRLEKLEQAQQQLDEELEDETANELSEMPNIIGNICVNGDAEENTIPKSNCSKRMGVITSLKSNNGTIDHSIFFDMSAAEGVASDLTVGARVEYLAFQNDEHIMVVKIEQVVDEYWDDDLPTDQKIDKHIEDLKSKQPKYFNTHQRNILGLVTERKKDSIIVDTDYKTMNIDLESVEHDFVPKEGDRLYVCCNVQSDENFVDKQGEILQAVSIHPSRCLSKEKCVVRQLHDEWGVLNDDCYFTIDSLPASLKLQVGDSVFADMIECERGEYMWRAINIKVFERAVVAPKPIQEGPLSTVNQKHCTVFVSPDERVVFTTTFQTKTVEITAICNSDRTVVCKSVEFIGRRRDSQLRLIDPEPGQGFVLQPGDQRVIRFEAEAKQYGESKELFIITFDTFRVKRSITLVVCEDESTVAAERDKARQKEAAIVMGGRAAQLRSRQYAQHVWSKKSEVIPGVGLVAKRRFLAIRINQYEVPERLRSAYLCTDRKQDMQDNIEMMYPQLKEDLSIENYTKRFATLLFLEEIEYFVNFRNYDRERAHFTRENEYLSLTIENLAERRPSLVIGDVVRAINPWADQNADNRSYDGVIHKVHFNRVLMKFNPGFQTKYNGEDYRLEFYFSRFGFRKMHYAINRIVPHLGEQFLFPTKVSLREGGVQLDVVLDERHNLKDLQNNKTCRWFNQQLNAIQKRAVCNILRGETKHMPYVIFGPPGTGKTMTLVETILQLVKLLPSCRLLVGTPSNSAADLITTRLIDSGDMQPGDFVRLVSQNQIEKELIPEHLMPYCATVDIAADGTCKDSMIVTESGLKLRCQMKFLGRHRVTISTCTTLGNFIQMGFPPGHFTHVLIDESGQCTEPDVMVPICQVSQTRGQVILAGDPHQLQAIVINKYASDRGFCISYLERVLTRPPYCKDMIRHPKTSGFDPRLVTKLLYNYRALPSILSVYNELFYDSELLPMVTENNSREAEMLLKLDAILPKSDLRPKTHGVFFNGVRSENMQENDSPSWFNPVEAKNVFLLTIQLYRQNISENSIGIITPYVKQVKHLRSLFVAADIAMPKIGSIEEFQGQERDIILISTVRSTQKLIVRDLRLSLGFVQCAKRMNVAISRARYLMFVFGNPHLLYLDQCWRRYIQYCVDNDAYLGCDLPEDFNMDDEDRTSSFSDEAEAE